MSHKPSQPNDDEVYRLSALLLRAGALLSVVLLASGMIMSLVAGAEIVQVSRSLRESWQNLLQGKPEGFLEVGLQAVILTPIITSVGICVYAVMRWQRSLLIPSLVVLGGLAISLWIGIAW